VAQFSVHETRHPTYFHDSHFWTKWREVYNGGEDFTRLYLRKFSDRESTAEFNSRLEITPTPTYAKAAINDIRNAIFQRMRDIVRRGGSETYRTAVSGEMGGVDMRGSSMSGFLGIDVLTEMLVMGKVGVYVDMPQVSGPTLADVGGARPYLYMYQVEDILAWAASDPANPSDFQAVLLRDTGLDYAQHEMYGLEFPTNEFERYRLIWIDQETGLVNVQFYDEESTPITPDGYPSDGTPITLELTRIPFILLDIGDSLLKDVSQHQAALLNLTSSDVSYTLKANYPFYTEQQDTRAVGDHLKHAQNPDGSAMAGGQRAASREIVAGASHGRIYGVNMDRPGFIHPSPEPLEASLKLQEKLEDDIRKLVNLAVTNKIGKRATSAEALKMSDQGLESGLSYIGLVLENAERRVADHWGAYEERNVDSREIATIKYPDRYSLKTDQDRIKEADDLSNLMFTVPGNTVKKELSKNIVITLLGGKIGTEMMDEIFAEIDKADYATSDPEIIIRAREAGLVGEQTASVALGFDEEEYLQARADHIERVKRISEAQSSGDADDNPAARGVDDLSGEPATEGKEERAKATETTLSESIEKPVRGEGRNKEQ
jgi:hypothetical protein